MRRAEIDEALGFMQDFDESWLKAFKIGVNAKDYGHKDLTDDQKKELVKKVRTGWVANELPGLMKSFAKRLKTYGGKFLAGDFSIVDLQVHPMFDWLASGICDHIPTDVFAKYPEVTDYLQRVSDLPKMKAYY